VLQVEDVPQIFLQETVIVAGRDIVEGQFTPQIALPAPIVRGLGGLPPLYGYNGTEIKETARTILVTPDGKPVLAQWQYGLGRAVAWTSDLKGQWARDWVGWGQFPRFVGGLADMLLPPRTGEQLTLQATATGAQSALELTAQDDQGQPLNDLTLEGQLVNPESQGVRLQFAQVGPGRYRAVAQTSAPGVYLAQVAAASGGQPLGLATTGLVVSYSPEYSARPGDPQLPRALAEITGGRNDPPAEAAFEPTAQAVGTVSEIGLPLLWLALLLLPLDIGLRRLHLRLAELLPQRRGRARPAPPGYAETLARLNVAKRRATTRTETSPSSVVGSQLQQMTTDHRPPTADNGQATTGNGPPTTDHRSPATGNGPPTGDNRPSTTANGPPTTSNAQAATDEEQYARLLAAKQRARRKRSE